MVTEQLAESADVGGVLKKWVEQLVFVAIDVLCPFLCVFGAIDPPLVVLCLNDEDSVRGEDNMVDLGGSGARGVGNHYVVKDGVFGFRKSAQAQFDVRFTIFACSLCSG